MPFLLTALNVVPAGVGDWLLRLTPAGGPGDRAEHPAVPAGHHRHLARAGLLPAVALRRVRRAVPVGGGGSCPRAGHAAAAGRMSTGRARRSQRRRRPRRQVARGEPGLRAARRVDQAAHGLRTRLAAPRGRGADHRGQRRGRRGHPLPAEPDLPGRHDQAQPDRDSVRPGSGRDPGRADGQQRVQLGHDARHARGDAQAAGGAGGQGDPAGRAGAGGRRGGGVRLGAGRAPDPARPRLYRRARLPPGLAELRADAASRHAARSCTWD